VTWKEGNNSDKGRKGGREEGRKGGREVMESMNELHSFRDEFC
jgi:hypothetical protein